MKIKFILSASFFAFLAVVLIPIAINLPQYTIKKFHEIVKYKVLITEKASTDKSHYIYDSWVDSNNSHTIPTSISAYFFNVTNPNEILSGQKPILKELGPYIYDIHKKHTNIEFDFDIYGKKIVRYIEWKTYTWSEKNDDYSTSPYDEIFNINIIFQIWRHLSS